MASARTILRLKNFFSAFFVLLFALASSGCVPGLRVGVAGHHKLEGVVLEISSRGKHNEKIEFLLRNQLQNHLNQNQSHLAEETISYKYKLMLEYETYEDSYAIQANTIATRQKAGLRVWYTLSELSENDIISQGRIDRSGSFYIEDSTYSTHIARVQELENLVFPIIDELLINIAVDLG